MLIDTSIDGHVHTKLCRHARGEMEEYVEAAAAKGLAQIIFLEHFETGVNYFETTWLSDADFQAYFDEGERLKKKYAGKIRVGLGVEVGYNPKRLHETLAFLDRYQWDRVGLSYHYFEIDGSHYNVVSRKQANMEALEAFGIDRVISAYFKQLREAVEKMPGQVLCHMDAVLRHHPEVRFLNQYLPLIREVFQAMALKKMALEVNTSGYPLRNEPYPGKALLAEAVRFGLPLVAGSDAHGPRDVGRFFDRLPDLVAGLDVGV